MSWENTPDSPTIIGPGRKEQISGITAKLALGPFLGQS